MSLLEKSRESFKASLASASNKIQPKLQPQTLAPVSPSPSVGSTTSRNDGTPSAKRKRDANAPVYSQPDITGFGTDVLTQMTYAVEYLKKKDEAKTVADILDHLSLHNTSPAHKEALVNQMRQNPRIQFHPDDGVTEQTWKSGTYSHRALIPNVRDKNSLLKYMMAKTDAHPVVGKELKDGWPDCEPTIAQLEREHRLLVLRNKKEQTAKLIWADDPSVFHAVDLEFKQMWHRAKIPSKDDIVRRLQAVGQKPASDDPLLKAANAPKVQKQKKKAQRRTGKSTNTHMESLLKDYSHMKRG
jgi:transcription initiation factor TFIIE subunit beta